MMTNEKRLRIGQLEATITNDPLAVGGTSVTVTHNAAFEAIDTDNHLALILDPEQESGALEIVYGTAYSEDGGVGTITVARGQEGTTAREHASGTVLRHGPTLRDFPHGRSAISIYDAANVTVSSTTPATLIGALDTAIAARAGDVLRCTFRGYVGNTTAAAISLDVRFVADGTETNYLSSGTSTQRSLGVPGWLMPPSVRASVSGFFDYVVQEGDLHEGGTVARVKAWRDTENRTIAVDSGRPLVLQVDNLGPREA